LKIATLKGTSSRLLNSKLQPDSNAEKECSTGPLSNRSTGPEAKIKVPGASTIPTSRSSSSSPARQTRNGGQSHSVVPYLSVVSQATKLLENCDDDSWSKCLRQKARCWRDKGTWTQKIAVGSLDYLYIFLFTPCKIVLEVVVSHLARVFALILSRVFFCLESIALFVYFWWLRLPDRREIEHREIAAAQFVETLEDLLPKKTTGKSTHSFNSISKKRPRITPFLD